jgi:hypothetical protein
MIEWIFKEILKKNSKYPILGLGMLNLITIIFKGQVQSQGQCLPNAAPLSE